MVFQGKSTIGGDFTDKGKNGHKQNNKSQAGNEIRQRY